MRTFEVMDLFIDRLVIVEAVLDIRDENGAFVPLSKIKSFHAVLNSGDALDAPLICTFQVQVLDDQETKVRFFLSEPTTGTFASGDPIGYWYSYYVDLADEKVPLLTGKVVVK